jgi:uncharacterized membrane protein YfhO
MAYIFALKGPTFLHTSFLQNNYEITTDIPPCVYLLYRGVHLPLFLNRLLYVLIIDITLSSCEYINAILRV